MFEFHIAKLKNWQLLKWWHYRSYWNNEIKCFLRKTFANYGLVDKITTLKLLWVDLHWESRDKHWRFIITYSWNLIQIFIIWCDFIINIAMVLKLEGQLLYFWHLIKFHSNYIFKAFVQKQNLIFIWSSYVIFIACRGRG